MRVCIAVGGQLWMGADAVHSGGLLSFSRVRSSHIIAIREEVFSECGWHAMPTSFKPSHCTIFTYTHTHVCIVHNGLWAGRRNSPGAKTTPINAVNIVQNTDCEQYYVTLRWASDSTAVSAGTFRPLVERDEAFRHCLAQLLYFVTQSSTHTHTHTERSTSNVAHSAHTLHSSIYFNCGVWCRWQRNCCFRHTAIVTRPILWAEAGAVSVGSKTGKLHCESLWFSFRSDYYDIVAIHLNMYITHTYIRRHNTHSIWKL